MGVRDAARRAVLSAGCWDVALRAVMGALLGTVQWLGCRRRLGKEGAVHYGLCSYGLCSYGLHSYGKHIAATVLQSRMHFNREGRRHVVVELRPI